MRATELPDELMVGAVLARVGVGALLHTAACSVDMLRAANRAALNLLIFRMQRAEFVDPHRAARWLVDDSNGWRAALCWLRLALDGEFASTPTPLSPAWYFDTLVAGRRPESPPNWLLSGSIWDLHPYVARPPAGPPRRRVAVVLGCPAQIYLDFIHSIDRHIPAGVQCPRTLFGDGVDLGLWRSVCGALALGSGDMVVIRGGEQTAELIEALPQDVGVVIAAATRADLSEAVWRQATSIVNITRWTTDRCAMWGEHRWPQGDETVRAVALSREGSLCEFNIINH